MNNKFFFAFITLFLYTGAPLIAGERSGRLVQGTKRKIDPASAQATLVYELTKTYSDSFLVRAFFGKCPVVERALTERYRYLFSECRPNFFLNYSWDTDLQRKNRVEQELVTTHGFPRSIACLSGEYLEKSDKSPKADVVSVRNESIKKYKALDRLHKQLN